MQAAKPDQEIGICRGHFKVVGATLGSSVTGRSEVPCRFADGKSKPLPYGSVVTAERSRPFPTAFFEDVKHRDVEDAIPYIPIHPLAYSLTFNCSTKSDLKGSFGCLHKYSSMVNLSVILFCRLWIFCLLRSFCLLCLLGQSRRFLRRLHTQQLCCRRGTCKQRQACRGKDRCRNSHRLRF